MIFSKHLKKEMLKAGLTNTTLANKTNISETSISKFVNGKRKPSKQFMEALDTAFSPNAYYTLSCARCADIVAEYGFTHHDLTTVAQIMNENN